MHLSETALVIVDVQESFRHCPYWNARDVQTFLNRLQSLIDGARERGLPVVQIFHVEETGAFSLASGHVRTFAGLAIAPDVVFQKHRHSALVDTGLNVWLVEHGIRRLIIAGIRTEQCCETNARHASDSGYQVDFVTEATLTFAMTDRHGKLWTPAEIKARTELVLEDRFAHIVSVEEALNNSVSEMVA